MNAVLENILDENSKNRPHLIIVDDEQMMCDILPDLLSDDFDTSCFTNPQEGLKSLREMDYDLLLVDLSMPNISGVELVKESKNIHPDSVVIVMTGHVGSNSEVIDALNAGAADILRKPFEQLENLSENLLEKLKLR